MSLTVSGLQPPRFSLLHTDPWQSHGESNPDLWLEKPASSPLDDGTMELRAGFEPTMLGLQPSALTTWLTELDGPM